MAKFQSIYEKIENGCQMFDANPNHFNTLNHGDFWLNNIMMKFKREINSIGDRGDGGGGAGASSTIENAIFIDFQDSCWASPAIDLHYFLNTSLCESYRPGAFEQLIDIYYMELVQTLKHLNYLKPIPMQHEFHQQFIARNFYGK